MTYPLIYLGLQEYTSPSTDQAIKVADDAGNVLQSYRLISTANISSSILSIAATANGKIYAAGRYVNTTPTVTYGYRVIWENRIVQSLTQKGAIYCIKTDDTGNVYVCGDYVSDAATDPHDTNPYSVRKYNANGELVWSKFPQIDFQSIGNLRHLSLDGSGNVYVCGVVNRIAKFDSSGNQQWIKTASWELSYSTIKKIIVADDGYIYTLGNVKWITKWDSSGNEIWSIDNLYPSPDASFTMGFCMDDNSNSYLMVEVNNFPHLFKFDNSGNLIYEKIYVVEEMPSGLTLLNLNLLDMVTDGTYLYGFATKTVKISCSDGSVVSYFDIYNQGSITNIYPLCINLQQTDILGASIGFESSGHRWIGDYTSFAPAVDLQFEIGPPLWRRDIIDASPQTYYAAVFRRTGQELNAKIKSFSARKGSSGLSISAVITGFDSQLLVSLSEYSDWMLVITRKVLINGETLEDDLFYAPLMSTRYDIGSNSASMTFSAKKETITQYFQTRQIKNIFYSSVINNRRRVRGAIDLYLEIGDTADIGGGESFIVDEIIYYCSSTQATMEVAEA